MCCARPVSTIATVTGLRQNLAHLQREERDAIALDRLEVAEDVTMVCAPDVWALFQAGALTMEQVKAVQLGMIAHCENMKDRFAILDCPPELNPQKVKDFAAGMEATLGAKLLKVVIFDRDYRCDAEVAKISAELERFCWHAVVHDRKELENFLLHPMAIERAIYPV